MADTYVYSRSRKVWGVKDAAGNIREIPTSQVPQAQRDKIAKKYAGSGTTDQGDPTRTTIGIKLGPVGVSKATQTGITVAEKTQREKNTRLATDLLRQLLVMQKIYQTKLKPKLDSGQIDSTGVGLHYARRGQARWLGQGELDPDAESFITKSGQLSIGTTSYYVQAGGGRTSAAAYKAVTMPHVPHPPTGPMEVLGLERDVPQWDLRQQGEQINTIIDNIQTGRDPLGIDASAAPSGPITLPGEKPAPAAKPSAADLKPLPGGFRLDPSTGKIYAPAAAAAAATPGITGPPTLPVPVMRRRPLFNVPSGSGTLEIPPRIGS